MKIEATIIIKLDEEQLKALVAVIKDTKAKK